MYIGMYSIYPITVVRFKLIFQGVTDPNNYRGVAAILSIAILTRNTWSKA